jgi:hypothetical protein
LSNTSAESSPSSQIPWVCATYWSGKLTLIDAQECTSYRATWDSTRQKRLLRHKDTQKSGPHRAACVLSAGVDRPRNITDQLPLPYRCTLIYTLWRAQLNTNQPSQPPICPLLHHRVVRRRNASHSRLRRVWKGNPRRELENSARLAFGLSKI